MGRLALFSSSFCEMPISRAASASVITIFLLDLHVPQTAAGGHDDGATPPHGFFLSLFVLAEIPATAAAKDDDDDEAAPAPPAAAAVEAEAAPVAAHLAAMLVGMVPAPPELLAPSMKAVDDAIAAGLKNHELMASVANFLPPAAPPPADDDDEAAAPAPAPPAMAPISIAMVLRTEVLLS